MASELLRAGLLDGVRVVVVGEAYGPAVREASRRLGAEICELGDADSQERGGPGDEALDMLVVDGAGLFAAGGLHQCLADTWQATRVAANQAFLAAPGDAARARGGRIVYLAPPPAAGEHADAARAALENLGRTLSIEWARHGITTVTIALGEDTTADEAAALVAYLASPAGAYFSGCQLDLRWPAAP